MADGTGGSAAVPQGTEAVAADFLAGAVGIGEPPAVEPGAGGGADHEHHDHDPAAGSTNVREFEHRGHHARIETTYRITIDGRPLQGHIEALPSGAVHYHRFPQYAPQSAVDVVKTVIDTIWDRPGVPDELADAPGNPVEPAPHTHTHPHTHDGHGEARP